MLEARDRVALGSFIEQAQRVEDTVGVTREEVDTPGFDDLVVGRGAVLHAGEGGAWGDHRPPVYSGTASRIFVTRPANIG